MRTATKNIGPLPAEQQKTSATNTEAALATLKKATDVLTKQVSECTKQQKEFVKSQQFFSSQYDDFTVQLKVLNDVNKEMRYELNSVVKKCRDQAIEIEQLKSKLNICEQQKINNNAIIRGIAVNDDARESVKKIAALSDVVVDDTDITAVRHILNENKPPAIVVSFTNCDKKSEFIKSAKHNRISSTHFGYSGAAHPIFVDRQLTTDSFNLFLEAKKLKKIGVSFVWIANGNILVREKAGKPAIKITSLCQIKRMEREIMLRTKTNGNNKQHESSAHTENDKQNKHGYGTAHVKRTDDNTKKKMTKKQRGNILSSHNGPTSTRGDGAAAHTIAVNRSYSVTQNRSGALVIDSDLNLTSSSEYVDT